MRRYLPAFDQKEKYRLVIASPYSPTRRWSEQDDVYLQNIVTAIVDEKPGYVHDGGRQNPDGVRIDKGHTEGLEPRVTEELVKLMVSARGGNLRRP